MTNQEVLLSIAPLYLVIGFVLTSLTFGLVVQKNKEPNFTNIMMVLSPFILSLVISAYAAYKGGEIRERVEIPKFFLATKGIAYVDKNNELQVVRHFDIIHDQDLGSKSKLIRSKNLRGDYSYEFHTEQLH